MDNIKVINIRDDKFYGGRGALDDNKSILNDNVNDNINDSEFNDDKFFSEGGSSYNDSGSAVLEESDDEFLNETTSKKYDDLFADDDTPQNGGVKKKLLIVDDEVERKHKEDIINELSGDPMFMVLTHMLVSKKGNSIADVLEEIKDHLAFIRMKLT
jgi:hypothetical protein